MALASPAPTALSPYDVVTRAQAAWEARVVPAYVSFEIPCADTFLDAQCAPKAIVNFVVRMSDGRTYAESIDLPKRQLMCGGFIYGPASTPFGFFRRIDANNVPSTLSTPPPPENFAADPVRAQADRIGDRDGSRVHGHAIRDRESRRRIRLPPPSRTELYAQKRFRCASYGSTRPRSKCCSSPTRVKRRAAQPNGTVQYRFAQVGPERIWAIVYIDATLPVKGS